MEHAKATRTDGGIGVCGDCGQGGVPQLAVDRQSFLISHFSGRGTGVESIENGLEREAVGGGGFVVGISSEQCTEAELLGSFGDGTAVPIYQFLAGYSGVVQCDAHGNYNALFEPKIPHPEMPPPKECRCHAHCRRNFVEAGKPNRTGARNF